ncbi:unnamed protein product [Rotaria sordida]|uniref:Uncharacterized protein n=1 Tax=Rotaria sordida TaxID=392033 RepID=A0A818NA44_9BILA|nr:unnamed protein product [Rotaria sordida]CAF3603278.1 unnamed protein product [Rotaria sordida]
MSIDMSSRRYTISTITTGRPRKQRCLPTPIKHILEGITQYDTPKVVRFESKWIATISLFVKLSLAISCIYLMCQRHSYQIFDRSPISVVTIKVKPAQDCVINSSIMYYFPNYNCEQSIYDVNDFITPATENSAISITIRMVEMEHVLKYCYNRTIRKNSKKINSSFQITSIHKCYEKTRCILPPLYRYEYENEKLIKKPQLCWFQLPTTTVKRNYRALNYILFIKHFVEFPQLHVIRDNLITNLGKENYIETCEYHPTYHPLCPKFRILKILEMIETNPAEYGAMFFYGSLIEIKINWKCNLDKPLEYCRPYYEFQRLDIHPYDENPYDPGSNFLTARYFFRPNESELHRIHTKIYNLHIVVSVTGEVGRFDLFQTTTSIGSFLGIFGTGTIVCDFIAAFFTNFKTVKYDI